MPFKVQKYNRKLEQYCVANNVFTEEEVDKIIDLEDLQKFQKGRIGTGNQGSEDKKARDSEIMWLMHDQNSDWLFHKFGTLISQVNYDHFMYDIDGFENFQYTVYRSKQKQHYDWHVDVENTSSNYVRKISASILLTGPDEYEGGELEVIPHGMVSKPFITKPKKGEVVVFASFMPHRVLPVTKGTRKSLVCWIMGPRTF